MFAETLEKGKATEEGSRFVGQGRYNSYGVQSTPAREEGKQPEGVEDGTHASCRCILRCGQGHGLSIALDGALGREEGEGIRWEFNTSNTLQQIGGKQGPGFDLSLPCLRGSPLRGSRRRVGGGGRQGVRPPCRCLCRHHHQGLQLPGH